MGALREDSSTVGVDGNQADNSATEAGAVYVFVRTGGVWEASLTILALESAEDCRKSAGTDDAAFATCLENVLHMGKLSR